MGLQFGENPEHVLKWLQDSFRFSEGSYRPQGQIVPKSTVKLMKSLSEFADRMSPCLTPIKVFSTNVFLGCDCNGLQFAILERSPSKIERFLRCHPNMISAQNLLGQTSLHLAADWPWACEALLEAGADLSKTDLWGDLPLSYACFYDCLESVQIFIAANSPLSHGCSQLTVLDRVFSEVSDTRIHAALINELARRRQRLLTVSQRLLPRHLFEKLTRSLRDLPDVEAYPLITALLDVGDNVDPNYWCYTSSSIYDLEGVTAEIAECLFEAGFTNLEGKDRYGHTILLRSASKTIVEPKPALNTVMVAKIHWLLSKGVSLRSPVEAEPLSELLIPSVNVVSVMLGQLSAVYLGPYGINAGHMIAGDMAPKEINTIEETIRQVLSSQYHDCHDSCNCHCSLQSCTPLVMLLKGWSTTKLSSYGVGHHGLCTKEHHRQRGLLTDWILKMLACDSTVSGIIGITNSALRLCLFEDLGLRHVCCRPTADHGDQYLLPPVEAEEARELQEEDEERTQKFYDLLPKAELEYQQTSKSFSEFWDEFYDHNIASSQEDDIHEVSAESMVGIGVSIHEVD